MHRISQTAAEREKAARLESSYQILRVIRGAVKQNTMTNQPARNGRMEFEYVL